MHGDHMYYIGIYKENKEKNLLVWSQTIDIRYEAPPSRPLPSLVKLWLLGQNWPRHRSLLFISNDYSAKANLAFVCKVVVDSYLCSELHISPKLLYLTFFTMQCL